MDRDSKIREALNRMIGVFQKKPQQALNTIAASAVVEDGVKAHFTQGEHSAVMDFPEAMGGEGAGPTPGFFARGGICGCVAMGKQQAILQGMVFNKVVVEVENDFDDGAVYGLGDATAAPLETRLTIRIDTDESNETVSKLVDRVLKRDSWFLALKEAQNVKTAVEVGN